ncbi:MAG: hypothetical protein QM831_42900 [Kofleriaceae bacterium]
MRALWFLLVVVANVEAAPPKQVPPADEKKIVEALQAALPPVDQARSKACQPFLDAYNKDPEHGDAEVVKAGTCFGEAGAIGLAIQMWNTVKKYQPRNAEAPHQLGVLYERAAMFSEAAANDEAFYAMGVTADSKAALARAACIDFQLGLTAAAQKDVKALGANADTLCDAIHPIEMPAKK